MTTPSLATVIAESVKYHLGEVNTSIPARILSYNASTQEASVQPLVKRRYRDGRVVDRAPITGVPIIFPAAGGGIITFPVQEGDTVLLIFSQRSIDRWVRGSGEPVDPLDNRKHDISDAMAIPGLFPFANTLDADPDNVEVKFGDVCFRMTPDGEMIIDAPGGLTINANTQHNGNIDIDGVSDATGDHISAGISGRGHVHGQPPTGSDATVQGDTLGPK